MDSHRPADKKNKNIGLCWLLGGRLGAVSPTVLFHCLGVPLDPPLALPIIPLSAYYPFVDPPYYLNTSTASVPPFHVFEIRKCDPHMPMHI